MGHLWDILNGKLGEKLHRLENNYAADVGNICRINWRGVRFKNMKELGEYAVQYALQQAREYRSLDGEKHS